MSRLGAKVSIKNWKERKEKTKRNKRSERKRKSTSQSCGQRNYASFSGFNWTRTPAPRLTVNGLILYAKYADCWRALNFLMQKEWRNEERTKEKLTNKGKKVRNGRKRQPKTIFNPSICFSAPNRAWTHAHRFTVIDLLPCATDACCFCLLNWLLMQIFGQWFSCFACLLLLSYIPNEHRNMITSPDQEHTHGDEGCMFMDH